MSEHVTLDILYKLIVDTKEELKRNILESKTELLKEVAILKSENIKLREENKQQKNQLEILERKFKKYNFIIYGIQGEEEKEDISAKVIELINNKLSIDCTKTDFRDIYRIGKIIENKTRPVVCEVGNFALKQEILKQSRIDFHELKKQKIFFDQDYIAEDYQKRKLLSQHLKAAKNKGLSAYIKNNKLVINGEEFSHDALNDMNAQFEEERAVSETEGTTRSYYPINCQQGKKSAEEEKSNSRERKTEDKKQRTETTSTTDNNSSRKILRSHNLR